MMYSSRLKSQIAHYAEILLLVLFVGYYACSTLFVHSHYYHNQHITHSHPFQKGENGQPLHQHNATEIDTIEALNNVVFIAPVVIAAAIIAFKVIKRDIQFSVEAVILPIRHSSLRAPPALA